MLGTYLPFILEMQEVAYLNCSAFVWPSEPQNKLSQLPTPPKQLAVIKRKLIRATGKFQKPGDAVQDFSSRCVWYSQDMERGEFFFQIVHTSSSGVFHFFTGCDSSGTALSSFIPHIWLFSPPLRHPSCALQNAMFRLPGTPVSSTGRCNKDC